MFGMKNDGMGIEVNVTARPDEFEGKQEKILWLEVIVGGSEYSFRINHDVDPEGYSDDFRIRGYTLRWAIRGQRGINYLDVQLISPEGDELFWVKGEFDTIAKQACFLEVSPQSLGSAEFGLAD